MEDESLVPAVDGWGTWSIRRAFGGDTEPGDVGIGERRARLGLRPAGFVEVDRRRRTATYVTPSPLDDAELVRSYLAPLAAVAAVWAGRIALDGGLLIEEDGAWGVLGAPGLLVVDAQRVLGGPGDGASSFPLAGFVASGARADLRPAERLAALERALAIKSRAHDAAALLKLAELPMRAG